jgi:hypothetical protein
MSPPQQPTPLPPHTSSHAMHAICPILHLLLLQNINSLTWSSARANTVGNTPRSNFVESRVRVVGCEAAGPSITHTAVAHV